MTSPRRLLALALLVPAGLAGAQRKPVLEQIRVPHSYYFREMYLPQATSGPSSACWSPDGRALVLSMQGALWRHVLGSGEVQQLTDGPGYDYQPDCSPDGRSVAYSSYRDDALELWLLDLGTGTSRQLTRDRAAATEPRFSPDGTRLAYVSTAFEGRFHVFVLDLASGRAERLTPDVDSGLPRYYYGRHDHYISPTWSPDGRELLFVSNRGRVWGSGGFWRMRAEPGATLEEVRHEETTWQARPDWAPAGTRVVYSSYLGRQWHQPWLMSARGGEPFPIGYGEHDVTSPRFSRDGRRIVYASNEHGDLELVVQDIPGGARAPVVLGARRYLRPVGRLQVQVRDAQGRPLAARVSITGPDGRSFAPDDAWRHADDAFDRRERRFEYGYFHTRGDSALSLPAGEYQVEVLRGLEWRRAAQRLTVSAGADLRQTFTLERIDDLPARGFWSGDLHVHMNYAGHYRNTPERLRAQAEAEDLHVVENLIVNKEQRIPDVAYFRPGIDPVSTGATLIAHGQEFHTSVWGHTGLLGLAQHLLLPDYAGYVNTPAASLVPTNVEVADLAHKQGALFGYVHPFDTAPDPANVRERLTHELPVDAVLGKLDYYEVVGFSDHLATAQVWYRLLNTGLRVAAGAGTDAMANYASLRGPVGVNRVFVKSGALEHGAWLQALKAGRSFATNGPLVELTIEGREPGDDLALGSGAHLLAARVRLRSIVPVDHLEVVSNGRVVADVPLAGDRTTADATIKLGVRESAWFTLRARADAARHPVLDVYPFATTGPIYVTVAGVPQRSVADARFFLAWVDRLVAEAEAYADYNSPAEKQAVLGTLREARAAWEARAR